MDCFGKQCIDGLFPGTIRIEVNNLELAYQYILTPIAVFVVGYILLRILGKKAVAEMTSFDFLVILLLGNTISEPLMSGKLGIASYYSIALTVIYILFSYISLHNRFKGMLHNKPTILINKGKIDKKNLLKTKMTVEELLAELRTHGYTKVTDVEMATLEEIGKVSVIPNATARAVQTSDLQITPKPTVIPIPLISDGEIIHPNLKYLKKDEDWLIQQMKMHSIGKQQFSKVTLATIDPTNGSIEVDVTGNAPTEIDLGAYKS